MDKLCVLLLTLAALLPCRPILAASVYQGAKGRPRPGHCPQLLQVAPSKRGCSCDGDCPAQHKCCVYECGALCVPPVFEKPGVCPQNYWGVGLCVELCSNDSDCPGCDKCCFNGCGHQCTTAHIVKPGRCGPPKTTHICAEFCRHDGDCLLKQKCCRTTCGHACSEPC